MNWDDPTERAALIERVGPMEYNRLHAQHQDASVVEIVAGWRIRRVGSQFGTLFAVGPSWAFSTIDQARDHARRNPRETT